MKPLNVIIIEDEIPAARLLYSMVATLRPEWKVEIIPGSVDDAVEWFTLHEEPDLIFLDIHLADGDAFDFLSAVQPKSAIIFTTAYDQYAIRAFSVNSIDYILKPVDEKNLVNTITKYESLYNQKWRQSGEYIETLLEALRHPEKKIPKPFLDFRQGRVLVFANRRCCLLLFRRKNNVCSCIKRARIYRRFVLEPVGGAIESRTVFPGDPSDDSKHRCHQPCRSLF